MHRFFELERMIKNTAKFVREYRNMSVFFRNVDLTIQYFVLSSEFSHNLETLERVFGEKGIFSCYFRLPASSFDQAHFYLFT